MFSSVKTKKKHKILFEGGHADERPEDVKKDVIKFIVKCFKDSEIISYKAPSSIQFYIYNL